MSRFLIVVWILMLAPIGVAAELIVKGDLVYTMDGKPIVDGAVWIRDGKIRRVGVASRMRLPDDVRTLSARVVTPGLIDAHTTLGLSGIYGGRAGQVRDQDQLEKSDPVQPALNPIDAYNAHEPLIEWARRYGVTTMHTGHGPGAIISGRTMVVKTRGKTPEEALVKNDVAIAVTLGTGPGRNFDSPGTRSKGVAMFRQALLEAEEYGRKLKGKKPPGRDVAKEVLLKVLEGDIKVMITAHTVTDISSALRLQSEFGFDLLLDGAADIQLMQDLVREAKVPVLLHAPMLRAGRETKNASFASGAALQASGVLFAYQTGYESYVPKTRVLLFETAVAVANGLAAEDALRAITLSPAEILGIDKRVGSLEKGKDGDLVLFDGDPFEYTSHVCGVVIEGEIVSEECH